MDLQLNDKTALITGSTGGIGLAIARKLAVEGAKVIITGRTQAKLDQAAESIRVAGGAHVNGVLADPATTEGAETLLAATPLVAIASQDPQVTPDTGSKAANSHHARRHHKRSRNSHHVKHHPATKQHSQTQ